MKKIGFILIFLFVNTACTVVFAQAIPSPGFEAWTSGFGYDEPDGWITPNYLSVLGNPVSIFKTSVASEVHSGTYAAKITTVVLTNTSIIPPGTIPDTIGTIISGASNPPISITPGFFYAGRPDTLFFYFKYSFVSVDTAQCVVNLSQTDPATGNRIPIASGTWDVDTLTSNYLQGFVKLNYSSTTLIPDTCIIAFASSPANGGGIPGSIMLLDDAMFSDAQPTLSQIEKDSVIWDVWAGPTSMDVSSAIVAWNDSTDLIGATIQITTNYVSGEDVLLFTNQLGITGSFAASTGTLTLSGTASFASYQAALRAVKYQNTSATPTSSVRKVTFTSRDQNFTSNMVQRYVNVINSSGVAAINSTDTKLKVYPNPAKNSLAVSGDFPAAKEAHIFDASGRTVASFIWENKTVQVDLRNWSSGIYFVNIVDAQNHVIGSSGFSVSK